MKSGDKILFAFPLIVAVFVIASAGTLFFSTKNFEKSYLAGEQRNVMTEAETMADLLSPMLTKGDTASAIAYCENFQAKHLRITLVRADGAVLADSFAERRDLDNHAQREEIARALAGTPSISERFSATENARMTYCALPLLIDGRPEFVLRLAILNRDVDAVVISAKRNTILALAIGIISALAVALYIFVRVRVPLERLRESAVRVADGNLNERISIPGKGIVRDLAKTVSRMKEQLKRQLDSITAERNGRELIFSALSEAVLLFGESGAALYLNNAARQFFGLGTRTQKFDLSRCGSPKLVELAERAFRENAEIEAEIEIEGAGTPRTLFVRGGIISYDGARGLLLAITDLTNLRRLESFRSDFIANVSHEIKTPLTGILGAVDALKFGAAEDQETREKFLGILSSQATRLNALVQDVLSLAALERRQAEGEKDMLAFRLDAAVENAVNYCRSRAEIAGVSLELLKNDAIDFTGDSALIEQAVINLVSNAIKYSESKNVEISLEKAEHAAVISVRDFGIGIAPEHCARIFERFYCTDKARSRKLGGTGLGLAIVKHIAKLHGGNTSVESAIGQGSVFKITLPL